LLPDTHSEVAMPIILEGQVVGVLDVQEDKIDAFDEVIYDLLRSVADQVAVGIRNAQQFEQVQSSLTELQEIYEQYVEQSWDTTRLKRFSSAHADVRLADEANQTTPVLTAPIEFRQTTIGTLELEDSNPNRTWSDDELALVQAITDQIAQTAENLRLYEETREQANYEKTVGEITRKLRSAPSLNALLEVAGRELGQRLGVPYTVLEMGIDPDRKVDLSESLSC
jgi:GAF domain-containing protein